jgi:hypothetical protein
MNSVDDSQLRAHQQMWHNFTKLLAYSAASAAAVLVLLALLTL